MAAGSRLATATAVTRHMPAISRPIPGRTRSVDLEIGALCATSIRTCRGPDGQGLPAGVTAITHNHVEAFTATSSNCVARVEERFRRTARAAGVNGLPGNLPEEAHLGGRGVE